LNRKTGLATLTLVLASETPDLDIVTLFGGSVSYLQHHRGITHSLLGAPFVAAGTLAIVYGIYRLLLARGRGPRIAPNWWLLFFYALLAALIHILLDFTNSYGVRPFAPFNRRWYSWDIAFVVDPIILAILVLALVIPGLLGLISEEIGAHRAPRGRTAAIVALICFAALLYFRDFEHRRAVNLLKSVTYGGEDPLRASAYATPLNPFVWNGVVETRDFFELTVVDPRAGQIGSDETPVRRPKPEENRETLAAKESRLGRVYLDWAQYPVVEAEPLPGEEGYTVQFIDLRFERTFARGQSPPLSGHVELDPQLRVVDMYVGASKRGR
jgi:inner membrane protein